MARCGKLRCLFSVTAALLMVFRTSVATADMVSDCASAEDAWARLAACTEVIDSEMWTGRRVGWAYSNRAVAHARLGNDIQAFDDHNRAIELDPSNPKAWNNRATSHAAFGEYDRALADYDRALQLDPGYLNALVNRASLQFEMGKPRDAMADYDRAIELAAARDQAHEDLRFLSADVACKLGLVDQSIADRQPAFTSGTYSREEMTKTLNEAGYVANGDSFDTALRAWTEAGCP